MRPLLDKLEHYLQRKSQKLTSQRRSLLEKIVGMAKTHFTADDLVAEFFDERPRVSKATIYRSLGVMVEAGILEEHQFGESWIVIPQPMRRFWPCGRRRRRSARGAWTFARWP
jgi:Fur family ferric uptake transcriptional regulator